MRRGSRSVLVGLVGLLLVGTSCRASEGDCAKLALHIAELAAAEGKDGGTGTSVGLETSCTEQRPTKALVECMIAAQTLAELEDC